MIEKDVINKLRERYAKVHPLIFHRSVEKAKDAGDLFDILDSIQNKLPIVWDENKHRWVVAESLTQSESFKFSE